ncbi:MAG: GH3 auxin-responsive promoter family protein [Thermoleophilia bacterium]|nr:GH3 auxin-responsive promoter family protein [Thermoleophilia bacterium]
MQDPESQADVQRDRTARLAQALHDQLAPWQEAVAAPARAQETVLRRLLGDYTKTAYGSGHDAAAVFAEGGSTEAAPDAAPAASESATSDGAAPARAAESAASTGVAVVADSPLVAAYRRAFPIVTYDDYKPLITAVLSGDTAALLSEEPVGWAITRGTVEGESKFIPMTPTDLAMRVSAGRAMMSYVASTQRTDLFAGVNLNLNFPSVVGKVKVGDRDVEYGYSSGIYTKHVSRSTPIRSLPAQDEIDALGGGTAREDWDARFELALEKCRNENVTLVGGVCQTALEFGRYLRRRHGVYPKELWKTQIMTLGSTPGINTRHAAQLTALYGPVAIREIYGATEGMFGQQRDDRRAWVPNYDLFFFEVLTRSGIKMLHQMRPGETGSLVVSTPILARYRIGDLIKALRPPYFRCIGRERWWTKLDYYWTELSTLNLGRV